MIEFMAGFPMVREDSPLELAIRSIRKASKEGEDLFSFGNFFLFIRFEEEFIEGMPVFSKDSDHEDAVFIYESEYLDSTYLENRTPRKYVGKPIFAREDAVFKSEDDLLRIIGEKLIIYLEGLESSKNTGRSRIEAAVDELISRARSGLRMKSS